MLVWQITDYISLPAIANLLGGYTGALTISISIIRQLMVKKKMTKTIFDHPIIFQIIVGTYLNQLGIIGYLPIIFFSFYSLLLPPIIGFAGSLLENMLLKRRTKNEPRPRCMPSCHGDIR